MISLLAKIARSQPRWAQASTPTTQYLSKQKYPDGTFDKTLSDWIVTTSPKVLTMTRSRKEIIIKHSRRSLSLSTSRTSSYICNSCPKRQWHAMQSSGLSTWSRASGSTAWGFCGSRGDWIATTSWASRRASRASSALRFLRDQSFGLIWGPSPLMAGKRVCGGSWCEGLETLSRYAGWSHGKRHWWAWQELADWFVGPWGYCRKENMITSIFSGAWTRTNAFSTGLRCDLCGWHFAMSPGLVMQMARYNADGSGSRQFETCEICLELCLELSLTQLFTRSTKDIVTRHRFSWLKVAFLSPHSSRTKLFSLINLRFCWKSYLLCQVRLPCCSARPVLSTL